MKQITVSVDVFARIWALHQNGEASENDILMRLLGLSPMAASPDLESGYVDPRHKVAFPSGFRIFRIYLGAHWEAQAERGVWRLLQDGRDYPSLNALSRGVGAKTENAWVNWFFTDDGGKKRPVSVLRDRQTIAVRKVETQPVAVPDLASTRDEGDEMTWRDDVRSALERLGGKATLHAIYAQVRALRNSAGRSVPMSLEAVIRRTLEDHSSSSMNYRGGLDLFQMPEGKGAGVWALRQ